MLLQLFTTLLVFFPGFSDLNQIDVSVFDSANKEWKYIIVWENKTCIFLVIAACGFACEWVSEG